MLNISPKNKILTDHSFSSIKLIESKKYKSVISKLAYCFLGLFIVFMLLPWTQNIRSMGNVTALRPDQRPQTIQSNIPGKIEKWFVKEGDFVKKGDTILYLSEIKEDYLDTSLVTRTGEQLKSKEMAVLSYMDKVQALDLQIDAITQTQSLKLEQASNKLKQAYLKVATDSVTLEAEKLNYKIAKEQYERMQDLYKQGLKSLTDLEARKIKMQEALTKMMAQENKWMTTLNEVVNAKVELTTIESEYQDKLAKASSEKFTAVGNMYDGEMTVTKLQNQVMNYTLRNGMYYIKAPQDGYITKAVQSGIGENIKEGEPLVTIMPANYDLAVEMYIAPVDLPLLTTGQKVQVQFDGWPAVIFSGWPNISYGTYTGKIVAIDNFISENGKYRVLVSPDKNAHPWPKALKVGAGASGIAFLNTVSIGYELWRNMNGFPPDYYQPTTQKNKDK
ncbi:MAG: HlyD family secretion protein [Bacteroidota bacterium]